MNNQKEKTNSSKKILDTAFYCLSTKGYANVSMRDIANEAGVALSQLNYHYKNKEGLFTEVIKVMIFRYISEIERKLETTTKIEEKLTSLVEYFKNLIKKKPDFFKLFVDFSAQSLWSPIFAEQLKNLFDDLAEMIEKNILTGVVSNKKAPKYSAKTIARFVLGALYGISVQIMLDSDEENAYKSLNMVENILV